jgi:hypothetical protein
MLRSIYGPISQWLLHEDPKEFFDYIFALVVNLIFVALIVLLLWPLGRVNMAVRLAKGYWLFWTVLIATSAALALAQRYFHVDLDERYNAYVISGLVLGGIVQIGWSAFVAPIIRSFAANASLWVTMVLYGVGLVSAYVASVIVGAYYSGALYRMVNSALAILSFTVFSVWPSAGLAIYGWFFRFISSFDPL